MHQIECAETMPDSRKVTACRLARAAAHAPYCSIMSLAQRSKSRSVRMLDRRVAPGLLLALLTNLGRGIASGLSGFNKRELVITTACRGQHRKSLGRPTHWEYPEGVLIQLHSAQYLLPTFKHRGLELKQAFVPFNLRKGYRSHVCAATMGVKPLRYPINGQFER